MVNFTIVFKATYTCTYHVKLDTLYSARHPQAILSEILPPNIG